MSSVLKALRGLWCLYERQLSSRPIPTQMATSCVLWGIGDCMAQRIEHYERLHYGANSSSRSSSTSAAQTHSSSSQRSSTLQAPQVPQHPQQLDIKQHAQSITRPAQSQQQQQQHDSNKCIRISSNAFAFDQRRLMLTSAFGAGFIGPVGHIWYEGIERVCKRLVPSGGARFLATKVVLDSAIMGSVYVIAFFAFIATALERTGFEGFKQKMKVDFAPTYAAELAFWPLVQTLNFSQVPVRHQLLVVNTFSLLDAAFISWVGNQENWYGKILNRLGMSTDTSKEA